MKSSPDRVSERLSRISIRSRLIAYLIVGLLPIFAVSVFFFSQVYRSLEREILLGHMATATAISGEVREFLGSIIRGQRVVGETVIYQQMTTQEMNEYFRAVRPGLTSIRTLCFALPNGVIVASDHQEAIGIDISEHQYFKDIEAGWGWRVSPLLQSPTHTFIVARRIEVDGIFMGVVLSEVPAEDMRRLITIEVDVRADYSILDSTGRIVASAILPGPPPPGHADRSWIPSVQEALEGRIAFAEPFEDRADGVWRMGASVPVSGIEWVVNVFEPVETAIAPVRRIALIDLSILLGISILLLVLVWVSGTRLSRPIRLLSRKAGAVAGGDFSQRMETSDRAEIGSLVGAFNNMTSELERFRMREQKSHEYAVFKASIGEALASSLEPNVIMQTVAQRTAQFLGGVVLISRRDSEGMLIPVAIYSEESWIIESVENLMKDDPMRVQDSFLGEALRTDRTIFIPAVADLEDEEIREFFEDGHVLSTIAVPMRVRGEPIGVLSISSTAEPLNDEHVLIAEDLATRLGIALENIRLYEDSLEREEFQRGLSDLAKSVSGSLEFKDVLQAICEEAIEILKADGVYVWVFDEDEERLTGGAACGYKAEEFVGMIMPLDEKRSKAVAALETGEGFFQHYADSGDTLVADISRKFHTKAEIFEPLISAGVRLGVLVVTDTHNSEGFDEKAMSKARLIAGYASTALTNARSYQRERRIAGILQRSLLSDIPQTVDGFELANFYAPARQEAAIGGDFYDLVDIDDDSHGLVLGDVSGKGLEAAVITAMAKYSLRAYVLEDPNPALVVSRTSDVLYGYTLPELFVTMVYGVLDVKQKTFRYASAGHEPILIYRHHENSVIYEDPTGIAAGLMCGAEYRINEVTLSPGDMLVLYTDGLTDARSPSGEFLGQEGLTGMVSDLVHQPASGFLKSLMNRVADYTRGVFQDDIAILVVRAMMPDQEPPK